MAKPKTSYYGRCFLCGYSSTKGALTRHLKKHIAEYQGKTPLVWLRVTDKTPWGIAGLSRAYWLDLEMPTYLSLSHLDEFLRAVWVECCDHLSRFFLTRLKRGRKETVSFEYLSEEDVADAELLARYKKNPQKMIQWLARENRISYAEARERLALWAQFKSALPPTRDIRRTTLSTVLKMADEWEYEYDYGTTTHLHLKVMARYHGPKPPAEAPIRILSRNYKPVIRCAQCDAPAEYWVRALGRPLCEEHWKESGEEEYLPIVNSPRTGLCAYDGPYDAQLAFEVYPPEPK